LLPSVGSITGAVRDENGTPVEAMVTLSTQGLEQRTRTFPRETFRFSGLKGGKYILCAQPITVNANPKDEPFVDSCLWHDRSAVVVTVRAGQDLEGVTVPARHGVTFKVRVNDPVKQLSVAVGRTSGNQLAIMLTAPSGLVQDIPIVREDAGGRDHALVIPYDETHKLTIRSTSFVLKDDKGRDVSTLAPADVKVSRGSVAGPMVINVDQRKP
jgi:hypothetical protein